MITTGVAEVGNVDQAPCRPGHRARNVEVRVVAAGLLHFAEESCQRASRRQWGAEDRVAALAGADNEHRLAVGGRGQGGKVLGPSDAELRAGKGRLGYASLRVDHASAAGPPK